MSLLGTCAYCPSWLPRTRQQIASYEAGLFGGFASISVCCLRKKPLTMAPIDNSAVAGHDDWCKTQKQDYEISPKMLLWNVYHFQMPNQPR